MLAKFGKKHSPAAINTVTDGCFQEVSCVDVCAVDPDLHQACNRCWMKTMDMAPIGYFASLIYYTYTCSNGPKMWPLWSSIPSSNTVLEPSGYSAQLRNTLALRWPQMWGGHILLNPGSYSALSSEHFFVPLLSVSVSESPSPQSLLWLGFQLWMLPLTTSVIPRQPTYPCLPPFMCDLMYCLTVFPPFKINCSFISPRD